MPSQGSATVVQETRGHGTIRLTADLFGHLISGEADRAADALDRALGGEMRAGGYKVGYLCGPGTTSRA